MARPEDDLADRFEDICRILEMRYGPRPFRPGGDPTSQLIGTILSQSTNDRNSRAAWESLRAMYATWDDVIDAPTGNLAGAIRQGGLSNQKAPRIQAALHAMRTSPDLTAMPLDEAMAWLTNLDGIGPKTAALVLLFALGRPVMPVDTHIARVMARLGIVPDRTSTVTKQRILTGLIGNHAPTIYAVHVETIEHGRTICRARKPRCAICPLQDLCDYYLQATKR